MKVWVVSGGWDYEGSQILGIFDTKEEAQHLTDPGDPKENKKYRQDGYDYISIEEFEVNARDGYSGAIRG